MTRKKSRQWPCVNSLCSIRYPPRNSQFYDMRITQYFEVRCRKRLPQRCNRRQGQDKITYGASSDDQDFSAERVQNTVMPKRAIRRPKPSRMPQPILTRFSFAVAQFRKSRSRQGEIVSQMPTNTKR